MYWDFAIKLIMDKSTAIQVQERALTAVKELMAILSETEGKCSGETYQRIKRGVGISVGEVQMGILEVINELYPEIDDLRGSSDSDAK